MTSLRSTPLRQFATTFAGHQRDVDYAYTAGLENYFESSIGSVSDRLHSFSKYLPRGEFMRFLAQHEIFKQIIEVPGDIIECGVHLGGGLMTWAQLSSIYEPSNHIRRIVGFDTFSGFAKIAPEDKANENEYIKSGAMAVDAMQDIETSIELFDMTRHINHIPKVVLVKGDAKDTIPKFIHDNQHAVVSLVHLDFDLFEPTKVALETLVPRMPRGSILFFDELNHPKWPGETLAVLQTVGLSNLRLKRFNFQPQLTWAVLE